MGEAVLASTAAPTMFPAVSVDGALHADGASSPMPLIF
jgi:predicted acylesterase/phospholipase RssA